MDILIIALLGFILGGVTGASLYRWHRRELDGLNARHERELQHLDDGLKGLCRYGAQYDPSYKPEFPRINMAPDVDWDIVRQEIALANRDPRPDHVIQHEREGHFGPNPFKDAYPVIFGSALYAMQEAHADATAERQKRTAEIMPDGEGIRL